MGREIRRVPANWEHPRTTRHGREEYQPLRDRDAQSAFEEWMTEYQAWPAGTRR